MVYFLVSKTQDVADLIKGNILQVTSLSKCRNVTCGLCGLLFVCEAESVAYFLKGDKLQVTHLSKCSNVTVVCVVYF